MTQETVTIECKYCGSDNVVKTGFHSGEQRYLCRSCNRKFKLNESPFHMKTPAETISSAMAMYYTGSSITDIRNHVRQQTGYYPSKSVVFDWIEKYTEQAEKHFRNVKPKVGNTWIADETMIDLDKQKKVWLWDIIDSDTRFILATRVSISRTTNDAKQLIASAVKKAHKVPKLIITDKLPAYPDGIYNALAGATEHLQSKPFNIASESTSKIERFHETLKERTKVMKAFRDIETLNTFTQGFLVYYNYLKPHESLEGKTPAEKAGVKYQVKTWVDVVNQPIPKQSTQVRMKITEAKTPFDTAYKRKRITPKTPRISQRSFPLGKPSRKSITRDRPSGIAPDVVITGRGRYRRRHIK